MNAERDAYAELARVGGPVLGRREGRVHRKPHLKRRTTYRKPEKVLAAGFHCGHLVCPGFRIGGGTTKRGRSDDDAHLRGPHPFDPMTIDANLDVRPLAWQG